MKKLLLTLLLTTYSLSFIHAQTILGIDISNLQGSINWTQVASTGVTFAFAKASEGTGFTDTYFPGNMSNGEGNGLYMGAYHFAHPDVNTTNAGAIAEANFFLSKAQAYIVACELPPVLDYEVSPSLSWAAQTAWIQNWMSTVQSATGITPILYTSSSIASNLGSSLYGYPLWIADPDGDPSIPPASIGGWPTWAFKQYSWTGSVSGISGNVDLDVFNGDINALTGFMGCNASPSNLTAIIGACPQDSVTLQWTGSGSNWYVDISPDSTFADFYNQAIPNLTSIGAPGGFYDYYTSAPLTLIPDSTYYWRVFNGSGETSGGSFIAPNCPTGLTATIGTCPQDTSVTLQWTGSGSGWYVDVSPDSTFTDFYNQAVPNLTSIDCPAGFYDYYTSAALALMADSTYYWRVFNGSGETSGGSFTVPNCVSTSISKLSKPSEISIYPNPTNGQFVITANTTDKLIMDLYDITGRHILNKEVNNQSIIDVSFLYQGVYSLTIKMGDRVVNKKLVIVR